MNNKPGTAKAGTISKVQNGKRGTLWALWNSSWLENMKKIKEGSLNSVTVPKNVKGGPFGIFWDPLCCKMSKKRRRDPLVESKKNFEKSRIVPKKIRVKNTKGGHPTFSRFCTLMFLFWTRFWRFEYVLEVRSSS